MYKEYGIKFVVIVQVRAGEIVLEYLNICENYTPLSGKFDLKNTVISIVAGSGIISFITMFCDFILLNYVSERKVVRNLI